MGNFARFSDNPENLAMVMAFDPGETTGWCVMGVRPEALWGNEQWESEQNTLPLQARLDHIEYGEIDCAVGDGTGFNAAMHKHAGLNFGAEAQGVDQMLNLVNTIGSDNVAIVLEDFILDFTKADQARHTLSPVRIISAFTFGLAYVMDKPDYMEHVFIQNRSLAKTTCTNLRLHNWGLYDTHSGGHARDATRHAFYFLRDCEGPSHKAAEKRWRAWPKLFNDPWHKKQVEKPTKVRKPRPPGERIPSLG